MDKLPGVARQRRTHISCRRGNRSRFVESQLACKRADRHAFICRSICRGLALCPVRFWLVSASGANRGHRAFHTSVAVVYAVMIEGGFSDTAMGKMILTACFVTDLGTVLALGTLFASYD